MISSKIKNLANIKTLITSILILLNSSTYACDICGCFMGLTPYDNQSNIGLLYRYRSFNGYRNQQHRIFPNGSNFFIPGDDKSQALNGHNGNPSDYELYRTMEIRARYFLKQRIELNMITPYNSNSERYDNQTHSIAGIGDVNLYAGYHLIRKLDQATFNQRLIVGGGIKLATGKSDIKTDNGIKYNTLMQPGTGSTDGFVYANYLVAIKQFGLSLNTSYKINGTNNSEESIANSTTSFLNVFYNQKINKDWQLVPNLQFFYEYSAGEKYKGIKTGEHQMNNLMGGVGADLFYKNIALNLGMQQNLWQAKTDHPMSAGKVYIGITYNFNQLYYLLKS